MPSLGHRERLAWVEVETFLRQHPQFEEIHQEYHRLVEAAEVLSRELEYSNRLIADMGRRRP